MSISGGKGKNNNSSDGNTSSKSSRSGQQQNSSFASPFIQLSNIAFNDGEKELGRGGFGIVKRGIYDGKQVAVKSLLLDESLTMNGLAAAELLLSEANKMRELQHPRIVSFLGFIMENCSLVLEFMPNGGLDQFLYKNREMNIPWAVRLLLALDVAEGMAYLHSKKYLNGRKKPELFHQDLKSGNVLLCVEDDALRAKISDFGLSVIKNRAMNDEGSKLAGGGGTTSFVNHVGGTQLYMAPELFRSAKFTKSCDVYAYGVVLLEIALVAKPTECLEDYPDNIKDNAGVPNPVKTAVDLALSLDPANRPSFDVIYSMLKSNESFIESSSNNLIRKSSSAAKTPSGNELEVVGMSDAQNTLQAATSNVPSPNYPSISYFIEPFDNTKKDMMQSRAVSEYDYSVMASYLTPSEINGSPKKQTQLSRREGSSKKSSGSRLLLSSSKNSKRNAIVITIVVMLILIIVVAVVVVKTTGSAPASSSGQALQVQASTSISQVFSSTSTSAAYTYSPQQITTTRTTTTTSTLSSQNSDSAFTTTTTTSSSTVSTATATTTSVSVDNCASKYQVEGGDSCWDIVYLKLHGFVSQADFYKWNGDSKGSFCPTLQPGQLLCDGPVAPFCTSGNIYNVAPGDTCSTIASVNGATLAQLLKVNPGLGSNCAISAGQNICLPN